MAAVELEGKWQKGVEVRPADELRGGRINTEKERKGEHHQARVGFWLNNNLFSTEIGR